MSPAREHVVRDVIHGYITLDDDDRDLVDTPFVQRLRFIRQNDVAFFVYPSLNTSRLEHSLGVAHVASMLARAALINGVDSAVYLEELSAHLDAQGLPTGEDERDMFVRAARWYGLLHDVGHLPFSHLTEQCLDPWREVMYPGTTFRKVHEAAGHSIAAGAAAHQDVLDRHPRAGWLVRALMGTKASDPILQPLKDVIDADVDADRIDATARDGRMAGGDFGSYDSARLMRDARLVRGERWRVMFTTRAVSSIEGLLHERLNTHRWIHFQPKVVAMKNAYRVAFEGCAADGKGWGADDYVQEAGYLDDAMALRRMAQSSASEPSTRAHARAALFTSRRSARPLWKRRDEYQALCARIAGDDPELQELARKVPLANRLQVDAGFEQGLNAALGRDEVLLKVFPTKIDPFEKSTVDQAIGTYQIVRHADGQPILLTTESQLVESLADVVAQEPAISVTVIGDPGVIDASMDGLRDLFVEVARARIKGR